MPPTPKGKPVPKGKGKGHGLGKKVGPLPLYAWVGIAVLGAIAVYYLFLRGSGSADTAADPNAGYVGGGSPGDQPYGGYPGGNTAPGDSLGPDVLAALQSISENQAVLGQGITGLNDTLGGLDNSSMFGDLSSQLSDLASQEAGYESDLSSQIDALGELNRNLTVEVTLSPPGKAGTRKKKKPAPVRKKKKPTAKKKAPTKKTKPSRPKAKPRLKLKPKARPKPKAKPRPKAKPKWKPMPPKRKPPKRRTGGV
jgi:hypothetical protein